MEKAGRRLRLLVAIVNFAWGVWAIIGGFYFLTAKDVLGSDSTFSIFSQYMHGYAVVGVSLLGCGFVSLIAVCVNKLKRVAAILCAMWCGATAVALQLATPQVDQSDIDAWLLLMCAFTCIVRWALLTLEPHLGR